MASWILIIRSSILGPRPGLIARCLRGFQAHGMMINVGPKGISGTAKLKITWLASRNLRHGVRSRQSPTRILVWEKTPT
jgi:hypothetical protein